MPAFIAGGLFNGLDPNTTAEDFLTEKASAIIRACTIGVGCIGARYLLYISE